MTMRPTPQNSVTAACESCGKTFSPRQPHHRQCDACFRPPPRGSGRRPSGAQQSQRRIPQFPLAYFEFDSENKPYLLPVFVSKEQMDPLANLLANGQPHLTTGQIRRFFNECRQIERLLNVEGRSWEQVSARFEKLSAHAQNASSGQNRKIPREFQEFIDINVNRVSSADDPRKAFLDGFIQHFEALVGFGAAHMRRDR